MAERGGSDRRVSPGSRSPRHSGAANFKQRLVDRYPVGLKVRVYYDPEQPRRAVIERELTTYWLWAIGVGAVFVFVAWLAGKKAIRF